MQRSNDAAWANSQADMAMDMAGGAMHMRPDARAPIGVMGDHTLMKGTGAGNVDGADPLLNPALVPTADPKRRGGTSVDILGGVNLMATDGSLKGNHLFLELGIPVYQNLDGPQLETDWRLTIGAQVMF